MDQSKCLQQFSSPLVCWPIQQVWEYNLINQHLTLQLINFKSTGWGSRQVKDMCGPEADAFILGGCQLGGAYWMAVAGTACTLLASILTVFAYR